MENSPMKMQVADRLSGDNDHGKQSDENAGRRSSVRRG